MSAPVFLIADTRVINESKYEAYRRAISAAVLAHGGRFLAHDQQPRAIEGDWNPSHMMIAEFASAEAAEAFHASDDFRQAFDLSHNCAMVDMVNQSGLDSVQADKAQSAHDLFAWDDFGQLLLISQTVLQSKHRCGWSDQWRDQFSEPIIRRGLQSNEDQLRHPNS